LKIPRLLVDGGFDVNHRYPNENDTQGDMLTELPGVMFIYNSLQERIPPKHLLRKPSNVVDGLLATTGAEFDVAFLTCERPSAPPD
jgi:hypothetical protein